MLFTEAWFVLFIIKAMYERVFGWVVNRINDSVQNEMQTRDDIVIGVLDIYGFEIFDQNR